MKAYLDPSLRQRLLSADVRGQLGDMPPYELLDRLYDDAGPTDYVSALQHVDIHSYLPDNILVKTDRTAMMHSLEVRVPLLDYELMELVATTPWKMRIRGKEQKYALKKVLEKYLPPETIQRKKQGFGVPLKYWFERDWKDHTAQMLLDPQSFCQRYFDMGTVRELIEGHQSKRHNNSAILYKLLVLEEWSRSTAKAV